MGKTDFKKVIFNIDIEYKVFEKLIMSLSLFYYVIIKTTFLYIHTL